MLDVIQEIEMLDLETENKQRRLVARNAAISALEGVIEGSVSEEEYNHLVAEYRDVIEDIVASKRNHLAIGVGGEADD